MLQCDVLKCVSHIFNPSSLSLSLSQSFTLRVAHLAIVCFTCFILFFVFPALVFASIESGWGFSDAFYYCFISLTTIGLGDYIPGDSPDQYLRPLYKICITCKYAWMAMHVLYLYSLMPIVGKIYTLR